MSMACDPGMTIELPKGEMNPISAMTMVVDHFLRGDHWRGSSSPSS